MIIFIIIGIIIIFLIYYYKNEKFTDINKFNSNNYYPLHNNPQVDKIDKVNKIKKFNKITNEKRNENFNEEFFNFNNRINNSSTSIDDPIERINRHRNTLDKNIGTNISDVFDKLTTNNFK